MAKVIRGKDLENFKDYEPPYGIWCGISSKTVDNPRIAMSHVIVPAGARNGRHYHTNCNSAVYTIKGRRRMLFGPDDKMEEVEVGPGDFIFIPKGEIHGSINVSDTEPSEMVACYIGVNSPDETGIVFVDPPKSKK